MTGIRRTFVLLLLLLPTMTVDTVPAAGINTNVALPVRKGGLVYRTQVRWRSGSELYVLPNVLLFGAGVRATFIGVFPLLIGSGEQVSGMADSRILMRWTVLSTDALRRTSRFALLGGLEVPSGLDRFSSHSTDYLLGGVYTLQNGRHELDADLIRKFNTEGRGVAIGDELSVNLAYQLRVFPRNWPERGTPAQVYAVLEANGTIRDRSSLNSVPSRNSGGTEWLLSPGVQFVTRRVIYEATIQVPVIRNLNGTQSAVDWRAGAGVRVQF